MTETPKEARARLIREQLERSHAASRVRAQGSPYLAPETVQARHEAELAALPRAVPIPASTPAAAGLPPEARAVADLPMENPPVHRAQIKPIPGEVDKEGFLTRVRNLPVWPKLSNKTRMAVGRALVWAIGKEVRGVAIISYSGLATAAQCCRTQAWRAIRCFRAHGILDIFNVIVREDNDLLRDPNAYSLRGFTKAIPAVVDAVKDAVTGAFDRATEQVRRFAHVWDMRANRGVPARKSRRHPAPA